MFPFVMVAGGLKIKGETEYTTGQLFGFLGVGLQSLAGLLRD